MCFKCFIASSRPREEIAEKDGPNHAIHHKIPHECPRKPRACRVLVYQAGGHPVDSRIRRQQPRCHLTRGGEAGGRQGGREGGRQAERETERESPPTCATHKYVVVRRKHVQHVLLAATFLSCNTRVLINTIIDMVVVSETRHTYCDATHTSTSNKRTPAR